MNYNKIITFYDDRDGLKELSPFLERYDISLAPSAYLDNNKMIIDFLITDISAYKSLRAEKPEESQPFCKESFFVYLYEKSMLSGYDTVFVICPYSKHTSHYKTAVNAARKYARRHKNDSLSSLNVVVLDGKQTGSGLIYQTINFAYQNELNDFDAVSGKRFFAQQVKKSTQFILTREWKYNSFPVLTAYEIKSTSYAKIDISDSVDDVKFDNFSNIVSERILKNPKHTYTVSVGCDCDFSRNILGRIKSKTFTEPRSDIVYSLISAYLFGTESICIHVFN